MSLLEFAVTAGWIVLTGGSLLSMWLGRREFFAPPSPPSALTGVEVTTHHYYEDDPEPATDGEQKIPDEKSA
jgi:hypothetical protein